eukprot:Seg1680.7 transcript_id=Seg1680.7/GoldUCD/mRNA.D3Y31 product="Eukaryotic translation elongation factor 1 epsilon-1" protein_id=Seg1680.7/GoldUCD/D3Y31
MTIQLNFIQFNLLCNGKKMAATLYLNNSRELDLLLSYLHLPPKAIEISKKKKFGSIGNTGPSFQQGDVIVSGFMTVAKQLVQFATNFVEETKTLIGSNSLENAEIQQWMSYCETHIKPIIDDVQGMNARAEELNDYLVDKAFFIGNNFSLADLIIFQNIHSFMVGQSFAEKEKYIHLSRWFDQVQNIPRTRHKLPLVHFHRTKLYN